MSDSSYQTSEKPASSINLVTISVIVAVLAGATGTSKPATANHLW